MCPVTVIRNGAMNPCLQMTLSPMTARRWFHLSVYSALFALAAMPLAAKDQESGTTVGAQQFVSNCAGCHGSNGRGGDKAPSIATMPSVVALSDAELIKVVHDGTPAGMPSFSQLGDANIHAVVNYLRTLQGKTPADAATVSATGDANAGRALYFGKAQCSSCHMIRGVGGFIASDLTAYGQNRSVDAIQQAIVTPDKPLIASSRVVEVVTKSGQKLVGVARSEDNFTLELQTEDGSFHFLTRSSLAEVYYTDHSLMPRYYGTRLTPADLNDIVSFLIVTGRAAAANPSANISAVKTSAAESTSTPTAANTELLDIKQSDLLQKPVKDNWVSYNGDYTGRRYSALTEVTPANASQLQAKWVFHFRQGGNLEVTPVVAAGVMFVTSQNDAYALDAKTGNELWHHAWPITQGLIDDTGAHHNRGVAVLGNRVYMETDNAHLLCLDARSGNLIWDVSYAPGNKNYGGTSAPLIVKNKVLVGTSGGDDGVRGFLVALDAQTGREVWRFWTIPAPGEFGSESWLGDSYLHGGGTTWMPGTYDPELNTLYWGTGNPGPDYDDSMRPGDDLYTCSVIALDPDTGKLKWHFQFSPHNMYDYDAVQTPALVDAAFNGQPRKLLVTANKNGFLYILDRTNGKYLFSKKFSTNLNWAKSIDENGLPILNKLTADEKGFVVCPSAAGGSSWYSPSYDPATNMFYFRSQESCSVIKSKPQPFEEGRMYYGTVEDGPPGEIVKAYVNAFSLDNLDFAWREPQVSTDYIWGGVMSTATGLVAYSSEQDFIVADGRTGATLWHFNLGQVVHASPMSYGIDGKQYFAIAAGSDLLTFGLPGN